MQFFRVQQLSFIILVSLFTACNSTKYVPQDSYLLHKVSILPDIKNLDMSELNEYLRQTPNQKVFGLWRMQLGIYNLAPRDTTRRFKRFLSRTFRNIGEAPVLFDSRMTELSAKQLTMLYKNKGYINTQVDTILKINGKKLDLLYKINTNKAYTIRNYKTISNHPVFDSIAADTLRSVVHRGMNFDTDMLNEERSRITARMRNTGYYNFIKDFIVYTADSTWSSNKVDVKLDIRANLKNNSAPINWLVFRQYYIGKVYFVVNNTENNDSITSINSKIDTTSFRNYFLIQPKQKFVDIDALVHNTFIEPNTIYNDLSVERTYAALNVLAPIKYVNITFKEGLVPDVLDSYIYIVPGKQISVSAEIEGTLTKGYLGGATQLGYVNKNQFKGAETLTLQGRLALEKQNIDWARETSGQVGLMFPRFIFPIGSYDFKRSIHANTQFTTNISYQNRPKEFTTNNITGGMNYSWNTRKTHHQFELFNLSYVFFPYIDSTFRATYITPGLYNKYNYQDHFIMRTGYNGSVSSFNSKRPLRNYSVQSYNIESAGNLLYAINSVLGTKKEADGFFKLFNVRYAQYLRGEFNTAHYQIFDKNNRLVYHAGLGVAMPFGNADIIPYERRFYAGGANSVRGWSESRLGPGVYERNPNARSRDYNQVGDLKLDLNVEYRAKLFWLLEGALFLDGGNVWTIKDYPTEQPGGQFQWNSFYNQIALSYGLGARLDFSFFVFRVDMGVRLFDPVKPAAQRWRTAPSLNEDFALHIAIGYPF
ncbi:MAG: hypothetical protein AUK44_01355 [Porphyromonadaceae bacterium CG2_30_38_12]|nr:MAG: hypothetical protein AUK44_01355 [Porphyromonadaceae bacterium CG2_30_38_12]